MAHSGSTPPEVTWEPNPTIPTLIQGFIAEAIACGKLELGADYRALWEWSVSDLSGFWDLLRRHYAVVGTGFGGPALAVERMPGAIWYPEATLNFAENVLKPACEPQRMHETAIIDITENNRIRRFSWAEVADWVARTASQLRALGVMPGDRVAAVLPNIPEAIVGMLASASIGAVWSVCSPDLAPDVVASRFVQFEPSVLIGTTGYQFNGKHFDRSTYLAELSSRIPSVKQLIVVQDLTVASEATNMSFEGALEFAAPPSPGQPLAVPYFTSLAFDHPLWALFSSGTTGTPKGIVHGHGGILLESLKNSGLAHDMGPGDIYYVAANTSWMVWNTLVSNLAAGAAVVTYSGSPTFGALTRQFEIIELCGATMFGVGAAYLTLVEKSGAIPREMHNLDSLRNILSTGSPLPPSTWRWVHSAVNQNVHLGSDSGGTDICSGLVGSNFISPVYLGESQGPLLGVAAAAWNSSGEPVIGELGELVVTRPMPSMPLYLLGDTDGTRYIQSYFSEFPGVWTQGDWVTETPRHGFTVFGRSDATLNRQGVRLGTGDIYAALQEVNAIANSLVLGIEQPDGDYWMPLFVALTPGAHFDDELQQQIVSTIRAHASPRHVPDEILCCPEIPLTHAGKRIEVPLKQLFSGREFNVAAVKGTLQNPDSLDWLVSYYEQRRTRNPLV